MQSVKPHRHSASPVFITSHHITFCTSTTQPTHCALSFRFTKLTLYCLYCLRNMNLSYCSFHNYKHIWYISQLQLTLQLQKSKKPTWPSCLINEQGASTLGLVITILILAGSYSWSFVALIVLSTVDRSIHKFLRLLLKTLLFFCRRDKKINDTTHFWTPFWKSLMRWVNGFLNTQVPRAKHTIRCCWADRARLVQYLSLSLLMKTIEF